jgi:hypothetical protein
VVDRVTKFRLGMLVLACLIVAMPPVLLVWNVLRPAPWDARTLRVRFESVRYEAAGLVFTYSVENLSWRSLRLLPDHMEVRPVQSSEQSPVGFPDLPAPALLEGHSSQRLELRMELPAMPQAAYRLEPAVPGISAADDPESLLPHPPPPRLKPEQEEAPDLNRLVEDVLRNLDGFELIDSAKDLRLFFPRGW